MKNIPTIVSGIILLAGCVTMGVSLLLSAVLPNIFLVYLTANPASFGHDMLRPDMTGPYVFSAAEIAVGIIGIFYWGSKAKA